MNTSFILSRKLILYAFAVSSYNSAAQTKPTDEQAAGKLIPKEFSIPISPLFDMMGVAPAQVSHTAGIKDFKVDWSFRSWKLNPNLAIQAQPVWELFYNRKPLEIYQQAAGWKRRMSSIDMSVGTIQTENNDRRIGGALKMNLYQQRDPLLIKESYYDIQKAFDQELVELKAWERQILKQLDSITRPAEIQKAREDLRENDIRIATFYSRRNVAIQEKAAGFIADNWNTAHVDIAFGKIYTYSTDSAESLRKLRLNRNTGTSAWLNFGIGLGKRGLLSGLVRSTFYEEELSFHVKDNVSGEETPGKAIAANRLLTIGINLRYGGPVFNFFIEFIHEGKTTKTALEALQNAFTVPRGKEIIPGSVKWDVVRPYTINFGGDWRFSRNVILNFGIRCVMDKNFKTTSFIPIANISCMMR